MDGSASYVPGETDPEDEGTPLEHEEGKKEREEREERGDFDSFSPMNTSNARKRGSSTTSTTKGPVKPDKKLKGPVVKIIKEYCSESFKSAERRNDLLETAFNKKLELMTKVVGHKMSKKESKKAMLADSIRKAYQLALDCGVDIQSPEFFSVDQICKDDCLREFFIGIPALKGRLAYLQRYRRNQNLN